MAAGITPSRRAAAAGLAAQAAAVLWVLAGLLVLLEPPWLGAERVYGTVVPAAAMLLLVATVGLRVRLGSRRSSTVAGFLAMWRRLERVLDPSHDHQAEPGLRDVGGGSTAARIGMFLTRAGLVLVVVGGVQVAQGVLAWRPTLWFGWFLAYAGALGLGVAIIASGRLARRGGILLVVSALAVFKPVAVVLTGTPHEPESIGPLLPLAVGSPAMVVVAALLWLTFAAGWWQVGRDLRAAAREAYAPGTP